jgi:hypothetical protein
MTTINDIPVRICIDCHDKIPGERMQATPHATRCVRCEREHERQEKNTGREQAEKVRPKQKRPKRPLLAYDEDIVESADGGFEMVKKRSFKSNLDTTREIQPLVISKPTAQAEIRPAPIRDSSCSLKLS